MSVDLQQSESLRQSIKELKTKLDGIVSDDNPFVTIGKEPKEVLVETPFEHSQSGSPGDGRRNRSERKTMKN